MREIHKLLMVYIVLLIALVIAIFSLYQWIVWDHDKLYEEVQKKQQNESSAELGQADYWQEKNMLFEGDKLVKLIRF